MLRKRMLALALVLGVGLAVGGLGLRSETTALAQPPPTNNGMSFAAGSAQVSAPCRIQFDARPSGGHVTEQCDFGSGLQLFAGPVLCFAASGNRATFVWQMQQTPPLYQQVTVVDNGAPGQGSPDLFTNAPESPVNPCPFITADPGGSPVLSGNFVVRAPAP